VRYKLRQAAAKMARLKNVFEYAAKIDPRDLVCKYRHRAIAEIQRPDIVEAEHMVNVTMSDKDGVQPLYSGSKRLLSKIRRSVDQDRFTGMFDQDGNAQAIVPRVIGQAGFAIASDGGNAGGSSSSEEGKFHVAGNAGALACMSVKRERTTVVRAPEFATT